MVFNVNILWYYKCKSCSILVNIAKYLINDYQSIRCRSFFFLVILWQHRLFICYYKASLSKKFKRNKKKYNIGNFNSLKHSKFNCKTTGTTCKWNCKVCNIFLSFHPMPASWFFALALEGYYFALQVICLDPHFILSVLSRPWEKYFLVRPPTSSLTCFYFRYVILNILFTVRYAFCFRNTFKLDRIVSVICQ